MLLSCGKDDINISEAAVASGASARMIRYYERIGLLAPVDGTSSGFRVYASQEIETLRFIRLCREMGFSIAQISALLTLRQSRDRADPNTRALALEHARIQSDKAGGLQAIIEALEALVHNSGDDQRLDYPILRKSTGRSLSVLGERRATSSGSLRGH